MIDIARIIRATLLFLATILLFAALPQSVLADTYIKVGSKDLHRQSERVMRAKVTSVRSEWNADRSFIFTYATLAVERSYKGSGPAVVEVRVPGGKVGNYSVTAESMPRFDAGDDVIVFLSRWNDGAIKVEGYFQGVSRIVPSPKGLLLRGGIFDSRLLIEAEKEISSQ